MSSPLDSLLGGPLDAAVVDAFLGDREFPLVTSRLVTFAWRGEADRVELVHWIHGLQSSLAFRRLDGTDLWVLDLDLPEQARMEYKLALHRGEHTEWIEDPLNPHQARDPFGANSVVRGSGYRVPPWTEPDPRVRGGHLEPFSVPSRAFGGPRETMVYLPARFRRTRRYPLLVVHDGHDYVRYAALTTVLDNLVDSGEIPPLIAVLTSSPNRLVEYAADRRHADFIVDELLPAVASRWPLVDAAGARGLLGASFGAVAALSTAWYRPGVFGRLLLQSGSFAFTDIGHHDRGPVWDAVVEFVGQLRRRPGHLADRAFVSCGTFESLIYYNRSLLPVLQQATGGGVRYAEAQDGHNWENWRDRLRAALTWTFPGPLWLTYE